MDNTLSSRLERHLLWINGEDGGERFRATDLRDAALRYVDLRHADLHGINLHNADLCYADLRHADLYGANLRYADLRHADLRYADLRCVGLRNADLYNADLRHADLYGANLRKADLRKADLRKANLDFSSGIPFHCGGTRIKLDKRAFAQIVYHLVNQDWQDEVAREFVNSIPRNIAEMFKQYRGDI